MSQPSQSDSVSSGDAGTEIEDLFRQLLDLPPARRESFLGRVRNEYPELVQELQLLMLADLAATEEGFLTPLERNSAAPRQPSRLTIQTPAVVADWELETTPFGQLFSQGRYELLERLGKGGFAEVWKARDTELRRFVAVKIPRPDKQFSPRLLELFLSEARKTAQLNCPGIVQVHDMGHYQGKPFVVSELMPGGSLQELLGNGPLPLARTVQLMIGIADALHRAHRAGLVHRDIKPANILLDEQGQPAIADFGLAVTEAEQSNEGPSVVGTVAYMSPEQVRGESHWTTPQSDIYSLGVMFYELITHRLPFVALEPMEHRRQILNRVPRAPRLLNPDISPELERICLKCLSKAPENRYPTAADLAEELRRLEPPAATLSRKPPRRTWPLVAALALLLLAVGLPGGWYVVQRNRATDPTPPRTRPEILVANPPEARPVAEPPPRLPASLPAALVQPLPEKPPPLINGLKIREIAWPGRLGEDDNWHLREEQKLKKLVASSKGISLIGLGELQLEQVQQGVTLELDIEKMAWTGACGLFWGYREILRDGRVLAEMQLLQLYQLHFKGEAVLFAERGIERISPESRNLTPEFSSQSGPFPLEPGLLHLKLTIQDGRLTSAFLNERSLFRLVDPEHNNRYDVGQYVGVWGVFNRSDTTWFVAPRQTPFPKPQPEMP